MSPTSPTSQPVATPTWSPSASSAWAQTVARRKRPTEMPTTSRTARPGTSVNPNRNRTSHGPSSANRTAEMTLTATLPTSSLRSGRTNSDRLSPLARADMDGKKLGWTAVNKRTGTRTSSRAARNAPARAVPGAKSWTTTGPALISSWAVSELIRSRASGRPSDRAVICGAAFTSGREGSGRQSVAASAAHGAAPNSHAISCWSGTASATSSPTPTRRNPPSTASCHAYREYRAVPARTPLETKQQA